MKDTGIAERLRRYTYKFMEGVERYGIMICRQWVRNEICEDDCGKLIYDLSSLRYILEAAVAERQTVGGRSGRNVDVYDNERVIRNDDVLVHERRQVRA